MVQLSGLDEFASQVTQFFKTAIDKQYPTQVTTTELTPEEKEVGLQWLFVLDKSETLLGRDKELKQLLDYSCGTPDLDLETVDGKDSTVRKLEDWDCETGDNKLCVVVAEGGWGKTALLAGLVRRAVQNGQVFYHFVGSTASSKYHETVLQRLIVALAPNPSDPEITNPESDDETKKKLLKKCLAEWRKTDKEMLIVIDGVNELDNSESVYHLSWLPPVLPPGLRCVVSTNVAHRPTTARLFEHQAFRMTLSALDFAALKDIASDYLGKFGKKLAADQLQQLVETTKVDNPLWISLMCEELRIFGDFRTMDRKLAELPDTMDAFLNTVIKRLLAEDETGFVKKVSQYFQP
nr:hypothetical protein BaRGS_028788 [Batillaria attramentaria]